MRDYKDSRAPDMTVRESLVGQCIVAVLLAAVLYLLAVIVFSC